MLARSLRVRALAPVTSLSLLLAACGGKVTVDTPPGTGGAGGTVGHGGSTSSVVFTTGTVSPVSVVSSTGSDTTTAVSVGPGPTTGVGPTTCSCQDFCAVLAGCGFSPMNCQGFCNQASPQAIDCVCQNKATCNVKMCFGTGPGGSTTGVGPGAAVSSSGGGPGPACAMCADASVQAQCAMAADACSNNPSCMGILQCHQMCGWTPQCKQACDNGSSAGLGAFDAFLGCAVCQSCGAECQGSDLSNEYCVMPP